jgi:ketohexokinase
MARILGIGIATLDIINIVDEYPREDDEIRAMEQRIARGGNVTNMLVVLSQLGHQCCWGGILGAEPDAKIITNDLAKFGIDMQHVRTDQAGRVPTSYITASRSTGSRTIIHYRDLDEFRIADFAGIDLGTFDWLHFEGRNISETLVMVKQATNNYPDLKVSIEIEKHRPTVELLFGYADALFFSKPFVIGTGNHDPAAFLSDMHNRFPDTELVCSWGADGACAIDHNGVVLRCPASPPPEVVDTIGAGDTFIAAYIDARLRKLAPREALDYANHIAGQKCGHQGFDFLL